MGIWKDLWKSDCWLMRSFEYSLFMVDNPTGQKRFPSLHLSACITLSHDKVDEMDSMETALEKKGKGTHQSFILQLLCKGIIPRKTLPVSMAPVLAVHTGQCPPGLQKVCNWLRITSKLWAFCTQLFLGTWISWTSMRNSSLWFTKSVAEG